MEALKRTFDQDYPEADFRDIWVSIEYPVNPQNYPGIWVDWEDNGQVHTAGIGHIEFSNPIAGVQSRYKRWRFQGYAQFTIVALSSLERDRLYDEMVRVMAFGAGGDSAALTDFRAYVENNEFVAMNMDFDEVDPTGNSASPGTPWGTDEIIYERTINMEIIGEFVSDGETNTIVPLSTIIFDLFIEEPDGTLIDTGPVYSGALDDVTDVGPVRNIAPDTTVSAVNSTAGSPTARQLLGIDPISPLGWPNRVQFVTNTTPSTPKTQLTPIIRARGVMANEETVDLRGTTVWHHANNQAAVQLNFIDNAHHADSTCSVSPALVGSIPSTPKAQVGRIWGLDQDTPASVPGGIAHAVPHPTSGNGNWPGSWQEWKSLSPYDGQTVDGITDGLNGSGGPWDDPGRSYINCRPGAWTSRRNWAIVDGVWFRDPMDGISSNGSPIEVRNCLVQNNHDDGHWMGGNPVPPPLVLYRNLYWNIFMGFSYLESSQPVAPGGEFTTIQGCIFAHTRALPFHYGNDPLPQTYYDNHAHANHMKWRGPTNRPKLNYINSVILMLGEPRENGLGQLCLPTGSVATNSHFIYYDMGHNPGDKPPSYAVNSTQWWQAGSQSLWSTPGMNVHVVSGTDLNHGACTVAGHTDHPIQDFLWPAVGAWITGHPQYGRSPLTTDWDSNNTILLAK